MKHVPTYPDRTGIKQGHGMNFDVTYQIWPNRKSLAKTIRLQQKRERQSGDWNAYIKLTDGEGY